MVWSRSRRFTRDNFRAFTIPVMIGDPLAAQQVATVQGAEVKFMQGANGAFRGGASVYAGGRSTAYLSVAVASSLPGPRGSAIGSVPAVDYGQQGSYGAGQLPGPQGPVFPTINALQALRAVGTSIRGS